MTDARKLLKIGAFAKLAGTNLRTLRYYEEVGLLRPAARSGGGFRYYRETDLNRIQLVRNLQELGLTLEEIRGLLAQRNGTEDRTEYFARVEEALTAHEELLDTRMQRLAAQRSNITEARNKLSHCEDCDVIPGHENNYCEPCTKMGDCLPGLLSGLF